MVRISFPLRKLPVRAFDSRAQGFSPSVLVPLARPRPNCPPPSLNMVPTHAIERYACACCGALPGFPRQYHLLLPLACHLLPKRIKVAPGRGDTKLNQPNRHRFSTNWLKSVDSYLAPSFEGESGPYYTSQKAPSKLITQMTVSFSPTLYC